MTSRNDPIPESDLGLRPSDLGLFLHASAVVVEGGAFLFLGHSTAGKSTIARLLGEAYPVLADDAVFASKGKEGAWQVVDGGFRFGEVDFADWNERILREIDRNSVPLRGCLRIHKASEIRMGPMDPVELARHLMDAVMEIDLQRKYGRVSGSTEKESVAWDQVLRMRRRWFGLVSEIARACPGRHLWFSKSSKTAELSTMLEKWQKSTQKTIKPAK